jgi:mono/diheme cytochrome c family protein
MIRLLVAVFFVCFLPGAAFAYFQADLSELKESIARAGKLFKDGKVAECVKIVETASTNLEKQVIAAAPKDLPELKKLHSQVAKTRESLELQGAEFGEWKDWDSLMKAKRGAKPESEKKPEPEKKTEPEKKPGNSREGGSAITFSKDVAPWMVEQCGRCHVNAERGGFSLATFGSLMKGAKGNVVLFPGDPDGSRIVDVIATGDMPRGGAKVSPDNLNKLKQWIKEGAKLDLGPEAMNLPLIQIARSATIPGGAKPTKKEPIIGAEPSGKETVSFTRDVAPLLMANCNGCHYEGTRNFGGLRFNNFAGLAKGGDSGAIIEPSNAKDSLLVKKLLGTSGARMPMGRKPLAQDQIDLISKWIQEGAVFDGKSKEQTLNQITGQAWAEQASHEALMEKRIELARARWKVVAPKREANEARDGSFFIIGDIGDENIKALLQQANAALLSVRKTYKLNTKEPLQKGGVVIFALKQRYDYSEFGTMVESRPIPAEWSSHWRAAALDGYIAMVFDKAESKINESSLVQQLVSLWIGSMEGVPRWFADGAGRYAIAQVVGPNDARVQSWTKRLPESIVQLKTVKALLDGSVNDEDAATIGFGVIKFMHEAKMKTQYDALVRSLASGKPFDQATTTTFGNMEQFLRKLLGKK